MGGQTQGVEARLRDTERWLDGTRPDPASEMVVVDQEEFLGLPSLIALYRAGLALSAANLSQTMRHAQRVLVLAPADDHFKRGAACGLLGLALWTSGASRTSA